MISFAECVNIHDVIKDTVKYIRMNWYLNGILPDNEDKLILTVYLLYI